MQIVCDKNLLMEYINIVNKAVSARSSLPILQCILLIADEAGFRMVGNDLELGIESRDIEAEIIETGRVALDARMLGDIVRRLPGSSASIRTDEKAVTVIKSGKAEFKILGQPGDEFPALPKVEQAIPYVIPSGELRNMIRQTIFSVAVDDTKPALTGELLEIKNNVMKLVSVDGFRISLRVYAPEVSCEDLRAIIPAKTLNELSKILPADGDEVVRIYNSERHMLFALEECVLVSRVIEGDFISYENVFTDDYTTMITVEREAMVDALERASLISKDARKNPVKVNIADEQAVITSNTEIGTSYDELSIVQDGKNLEIAFNPRYLIDALKALETERVEMQFTTPLSPCIIKGEDVDIQKYLVLPLRVKS